MSTTSFWKRIAESFRIGSETVVHADAPQGALVVRATEHANGNGNGHRGGHEPLRLGWFSGAGRNELREGYRRSLELMDAMRLHFERQDRRAEQLAAAVGRVAETLERLELTARTHGESIAGIAQHAESANRHSAALSATLTELPGSIQAQADAVRVVARQMEVSSEVSGQLVHSLQRVNQAADTLRDASATQLTTLERTVAVDGERHDALKTFIQVQSRRLTTITVIAGVSCVLALGGLTAVLVMTLGR